MVGCRDAERSGTSACSASSPKSQHSEFRFGNRLQKSERIHQQMPFAAFDLSARIITDAPAMPGGLDVLTSRTAAVGRLRLPFTRRTRTRRVS